MTINSLEKNSAVILLLRKTFWIPKLSRVQRFNVCDSWIGLKDQIVLNSLMFVTLGSVSWSDVGRLKLVENLANAYLSPPVILQSRLCNAKYIYCAFPPLYDVRSSLKACSITMPPERGNGEIRRWTISIENSFSWVNAIAQLIWRRSLRTLHGSASTCTCTLQGSSLMAVPHSSLHSGLLGFWTVQKVYLSSPLSMKKKNVHLMLRSMGW